MSTEEDYSVIRFSDKFDLTAQSPSFKFYSLFTVHGLLMMGRERGNSDPLSYQFCCYSYSGDVVYTWTSTSEFGLCLADCRPESLVTPRALNYFHNTGRYLVWSERTHRGASLVCHHLDTWIRAGYAPDTCTRHVWRASQSMSACLNKPWVLVSGCEMGGVVCTVRGGAGGVVAREEATGRVIWEENVGVEVENIWVGDTIILIIPQNFKHNNTLSCISVKD